MFQMLLNKMTQELSFLPAEYLSYCSSGQDIIKREMQIFSLIYFKFLPDFIFFKFSG